MITTTLAGCLGGADVETDEGDDVVLENTDNWPTYYVATASDLPTCPDAANSGKLYYVEDVAEFQACTSAGWTTINIGGGLVNNQPPAIGLSVSGLEIDWDSGSTPIYNVIVGWSIADVDGTIQSMGLDYDSDGVTDTQLTSPVGSEEFQIQPDFTWVQSESAPVQIDGSTVIYCTLRLFLSINVIAVDDDGATTTERSFSNLGAYDSQNAQYTEDNHPGFIPQTDYDWINDTAGTGPCNVDVESEGPDMYQYSATDHSDTVDSGTSDSLFVLQFQQAPEDFNWAYLSVQIIGDDGTPTTCSIDAGVGNCLLVQYGNDPLTWEVSEVIHVIENGKAICDSSPCVLTIKISDTRNGVDLNGSGSVVVE